MMVGTGKLALLTLATAILFISSSASGLSPGEGEKQSLECNQLPASLANRLLGLMDWTSYMRTFRKRYSSISQQLVRQKIFMAKLIEVFIVEMKFRWKQIGYSISINKFSDLTPSESRRILSADTSEPTKEDFTDDDQAEQLIRNQLERLENESANTKLRRRRRSLESSHEKVSDSSPANVSFDQLLVSLKNPLYEPIRRYQSFVEQQDDLVEDIPADSLAEAESAAGEGLAMEPAKALSQVKSAICGAVNWLSQEKAAPVETVWIHDWRKSGCINPKVFDQGKCNCCYAISTMSIVEWALCRHSKAVKPVDLSIQYLVSCGAQYNMESRKSQLGLYGCMRGNSQLVSDFIAEFGVELEQHMPYVGRETRCPIKLFTAREKRGFIRPIMGPPIRLAGGTKKLHLALKAGPVGVGMRRIRDLLSYKEGIVDSCHQDGGHAMLVVGQAIENGVEYLLIKNSFGPDWGEEGYFKFKLSAAAECIKEFIVPVISFQSENNRDDVANQ